MNKETPLNESPFKFERSFEAALHNSEILLVNGGDIPKLVEKLPRSFTHNGSQFRSTKLLVVQNWTSKEESSRRWRTQERKRDRWYTPEQVVTAIKRKCGRSMLYQQGQRWSVQICVSQKESIWHHITKIQWSRRMFEVSRREKMQVYLRKEYITRKTIKFRSHWVAQSLQTSSRKLCCVQRSKQQE